MEKEEFKKLKIKTWGNADIISVEHLLIEYQKLLLFAQQVEKTVDRLTVSWP